MNPLHFVLALAGALFLLAVVGFVAALMADAWASDREVRKAGLFCLFLAVVFVVMMANK